MQGASRLDQAGRDCTYRNDPTSAQHCVDEYPFSDVLDTSLREIEVPIDGAKGRYSSMLRRPLPGSRAGGRRCDWMLILAGIVRTAVVGARVMDIVVPEGLGKCVVNLILRRCYRHPARMDRRRVKIVRPRLTIESCCSVDQWCGLLFALVRPRSSSSRNLRAVVLALGHVVADSNVGRMLLCAPWPLALTCIPSLFIVHLSGTPQQR
jgi:hypothetical protein